MDQCRLKIGVLLHNLLPVCGGDDWRGVIGKGGYRVQEIGVLLGHALPDRPWRWQQLCTDRILRSFKSLALRGPGLLALQEDLLLGLQLGARPFESFALRALGLLPLK